MLTTFIHTGDFHLGRPFSFKQQGNYYGKNKRKELWKAFEFTIQFAKDMKIPLILIAGDLFDSVNVLSMDVKRVAEAFGSLVETQVVIITGNHDYHGDNSPYNKAIWPKNVFIFKEDRFSSVYIETLNTEIFGMSWVRNQYRQFPEGSFNSLKLEDTRYNILLVHGEVGGQGTYLPLDLKLLESKGFDAIALGHIHKPGMAPGNVAYCGTPVPLHFGETGDHGFLVSQIKTDYVNHQFTTTSGLNPIPSRSYQRREIQVTPENSYNDIIEKVLNCDNEEKRQQDFYRICFTGFIDPQIQLEWINDDLEDDFYYVETDTSMLELEIDIEQFLRENKNNSVGQFLEALESIPDPEVRKKALVYSIEAMVGEGVLR
ncbi:MAG TPA: DNA repair exonuclease [Acetobacterium sp.]